MELLQSKEFWFAVTGLLLAASEIIGMTKLKSNGVFQLIVNILKSVASKKK